MEQMEAWKAGGVACFYANKSQEQFVSSDSDIAVSGERMHLFSCMHVAGLAMSNHSLRCILQFVYLVVIFPLVRWNCLRMQDWPTKSCKPKTEEDVSFQWATLLAILRSNDSVFGELTLKHRNRLLMQDWSRKSWQPKKQYDVFVSARIFLLIARARLARIGVFEHIMWLVGAVEKG